MDGCTLGRLSLRWDAAHCAVAAVILAVAAAPLAGALDLAQPWLVFGAGVVLVWVAAFRIASDRTPIRSVVATVLLVNAIAAMAVAAFAATSTSGWLLVLLLAVAVEVGGFAISQARALRTWPSPA